MDFYLPFEKRLTILRREHPVPANMCFYVFTESSFYRIQIEFYYVNMCVVILESM